MSTLPALKFDGEKPRTDLVPWDVVLEAAKVFTYGAAKYDDRNYFGLSQSRLYGAVQRHLIAWYTGEDTDPETGESHLSHALCGVMMLLEKEMHELGDDDRPWPARDRQSEGDRSAGAPSTPQESAGIGGKWARLRQQTSEEYDAETRRLEAEQECAAVADARRHL